MELLERETFLNQMSAVLREVVDGAGRVVLVRGEAGVGKTSLVEWFAQAQKTARVLWGACDALFTPRPLGPLYDVAAQTRGEVARLLRAEAPPETIFTALIDDLRDAAPAVLVVEDAHWADEATLDLVKFLGRRVTRLAVMLVVTYRDDEVGPDHPLRSVLGDLPRASVVRLRLPPLSQGAVAELAGRAGRDAGALYAVTGGNPFFVTEVIASASNVPATVSDAVLARASRLSAPARAVLELISVVPARAERWLVDRALGPEPDALAECIDSGVLRADAETLAFRHELARMAIKDVISEPRRRTLHARVLEALAAREPDRVDVARLVHHAAEAGDSAAILKFAPAAARQAAALSAHRQAAAHYRTALDHAGALPERERAALYEGLSYECYLTDQSEEALEARRAAFELWDRLGEQRSRGDCLRWMSRLSWFHGRKDAAERYADDAVATLEPLEPGRELAMAYSNRAQIHALAGETDEAVRWGSRAIELADRLGDVETLAHALNNVGMACVARAGDEGQAKLEESLRLSLTHDLQEHAARAFTNLGTSFVMLRDYEHAARYLDEGIAYSIERDLDSWALYLTSWRARLRFERGDWRGAADDAARVLGGYRVAPITRVPALAVLGHVRARRGDPDAWGPLDEAWPLALGTAELQRMAPVAAARAEAAWFSGAPERAAREASDALALAVRLGDPWKIGELAIVAWRAGALSSPPEGAAEPYALEMAGRWREAAVAWDRIGCPYERAWALARGDDEARREALDLFEELGAAPAADVVRHDLKARGVRNLPRGPRATTRENPAGLTSRQLEVLALLAEGLSNADIAERLFISAKTVDHHVSAILAKLDTGTRAEAVAAAIRRGLLEK